MTGTLLSNLTSAQNQLILSVTSTYTEGFTISSLLCHNTSNADRIYHATDSAAACHPSTGSYACAARSFPAPERVHSATSLITARHSHVIEIKKRRKGEREGNILCTTEMAPITFFFFSLRKFPLAL